VRLTIVAVGRLPARTPEAVLVSDYLARANAAGRGLALGPFELVEVEGRKPGKTAEAEAILGVLDPSTYLIACDEHGAAWTSRELAQRIARWRDAGVRRLAVVLGGADGLDAALLARAPERLAFGLQTWPHALARVMVAEQLYRTATILAGSPYHRD
jgi:23S rRNA (pseudouridine1915-N3)-methyltransferase